MGKVAVVVLIDVAAHARLWGFWYFLACRLALSRTPGLVFWKVMGSGQNGGFQLKPSPSHQGLFCAFETDEDATAFLARSPVVGRYRAHAREFFSVKLRAFSSRGAWSGQSPLALEKNAVHPEGIIAALTRASIRPAVATRFWRRAPSTEASLRAAPGCLLAAGLGEAPLFRQATFSIWESAAAMDAYARTGAHAEAIRAAAQERYFSESLFVRFIPYDAEGAWQGCDASQIMTRPIATAQTKNTTKNTTENACRAAA
jgi:heme-degrading monooxygenase HmoA